jgi:hypothetical protein
VRRVRLIRAGVDNRKIVEVTAAPGVSYQLNGCDPDSSISIGLSAPTTGKNLSGFLD